MSEQSQHIFEFNETPNEAPSSIGSHGIDVSRKKSYVSLGTDSPEDWVEEVTKANQHLQFMPVEILTLTQEDSFNLQPLDYAGKLLVIEGIENPSNSDPLTLWLQAPSFSDEQQEEELKFMEFSILNTTGKSLILNLGSYGDLIYALPQNFIDSGSDMLIGPNGLIKLKLIKYANYYSYTWLASGLFEPAPFAEH